MPLSLGQQQPTSERRKGDQMFGITTVGSDTAQVDGGSPQQGVRACLASWLYTAPPAQSYRKRTSAEWFLNQTQARGLIPQKMDGLKYASRDIYFNPEWPQQIPSSPTAIYGADVPADKRSCALALKVCPLGCNL